MNKLNSSQRFFAGWTFRRNGGKPTVRPPWLSRGWQEGTALVVWANPFRADMVRRGFSGFGALDEHRERKTAAYPIVYSWRMSHPMSVLGTF